MPPILSPAPVLPRRSPRIRRPIPPPSPPPRPRPSLPTPQLLSDRASRALKRRKLTDDSDDLQNGLRSIKRRKPNVPLNSQRRQNISLATPATATLNVNAILDSSTPVQDSTILSVRQPTPAVQPISLSRFIPRGRSPLSSSSLLPPSPFPSAPTFNVFSSSSHPSFSSSARPRKRRNLYLENQGRICDLWKYCCIERVESQFAKYGYANVIAAEHNLLTNTLSSLDRARFRISTPSMYDDAQMSFYDDEDEDDDCELDDIDKEILKTIEDESKLGLVDDDDGMLDIDAEGELDPDHIPVPPLSNDPTSIAPADTLPICPDPSSPFPSYPDCPPLPPIPVPFPPLASICVPGIGNAISDDVLIGPAVSKLSRGSRVQEIINVRGKEVVEWKHKDQDEYMGRGTPLDYHRRNDWLRIIHPPPSPTTAAQSAVVPVDLLPMIPPPQDWSSFLDSLARFINMRNTDGPCTVSFGGDITMSDVSFETLLALNAPSSTITLDLPDLQHHDQIYSGQLLFPLSGPGFCPSPSPSPPVPVPTPSSSTLSRALG